jgi:hypothetical protein
MGGQIVCARMRTTARRGASSGASNRQVREDAAARPRLVLEGLPPRLHLGLPVVDQPEDFRDALAGPFV